jgi:hypothetical protein
MFKNIIIAILVLSNFVFLVFALYQKSEAERMTHEAMTQRAIAESSEINARRMEIEARAQVVIATQITDSLRNELSRVQK